MRPVLCPAQDKLKPSLHMQMQPVTTSHFSLIFSVVFLNPVAMFLLERPVTDTLLHCAT